MPKAILVTDVNQTQILGQFDIDPDELEEEMVGYYLVADFAGTMVDGFLLGEELRLLYTTTDKKLENDWFEIIERKVAL